MMTCGTNAEGEYVARELAEEQTLETLEAFSERITMMHDTYLRGTDRCDCTGEPDHESKDYDIDL